MDHQEALKEHAQGRPVMEARCEQVPHRKRGRKELLRQRELCVQRP